MTGAASGIGKATALLLARHGAKVHLVDIAADRLIEVADLVRAEGGEPVTHVVDVSDPAAMAELADAVFAGDAAVDLLHNNAGIGVGGRFIDLTLDDIQRTVGVNLLGTMYGLHYFLPRMRKQGRRGHIVNTASGAGLVPIPLLGTYSAAKHGVVALTEALHAEHADGQVGFSVVCPGVIDTPILRNSPQRGGLVDVDLIDRLAKRFAASPESVAEAVWDAYARRKVVVVVAPLFVTPAWWLRRLSPRAAQFGSRLTAVALEQVLGGAAERAGKKVNA
ncbi:SDR family oxidoreductase [Antrihabitans sp. YC2-6]|uniref:SDR family NAD(P)-dependent oxidoreductase n=1 Tax=Antrihabitans sp. YC2-6 TaxID=2799498 RepID=UPI0018F7A144|nr:SDR family oxidoreductase [Antrihabitans sp. YC2-6]MBJ8348124.1 SDR family oxidoreductase [Antrihabitans sp. YC2-6]